MQFQHKLHIVYLVNDILHHCQRKGAQDLKKSFEGIIVPLFFCTQIGESPENLQKVTKVLGIWESHNLFEASLLQVNFKFSMHFRGPVREMFNDAVSSCFRVSVKQEGTTPSGIHRVS